MSTPSPALPPRPPFDVSAWLPRKRALLWILLAFGIGLLLFALVLSTARDDGFYRADSTRPEAGPRAVDHAPLPAPMTGDDGTASGFGEKPARIAEGEGRPELVETRPPPPPQGSAPAPPPATPAAASRPLPIASSTPAPRYPAAALRRGDSGTVVVEAQVLPDGSVGAVSVADGSGSRQLDRAALDAVKRWRFQPAVANGQPTTASVRVPIEFNARR